MASSSFMRAAPGICRVEREAEHRVRARPAGEVVDRAQLVHGLGEALRVELGQLALVELSERLGAVARLGEHLLDPLGAASLGERVEVPGG